LTLVVPRDSNSDLSLGQSEEKFIVALIWPGHASDRTVLGELVANGLLLFLFETNLVYEYDVVGLGYRHPLIIR